MFKNFNWYTKFGMIPSEFREAMSYEEQILWLCKQIEDLKAGTGNYNYELLMNKPKINNVTLEGNSSLQALGIQEKLIPGSGITISGNIISATGGGGGSETFPVKVLTENVVLEDYQIPSLEEGLYYLSNGVNIYYDNIVAGEELFNENDIVYWNATNRIFSNGVKYVKYYTLTNNWDFLQNAKDDVFQSNLILDNEGRITWQSIYPSKPNFSLLGAFNTGSYKVYHSIDVSTTEEFVGRNQMIYITSDLEIYTDKYKIYYDGATWNKVLNTSFVTELSEDIVLLAGTPTSMDSGFYKFDSSHGLYYHSSSSPDNLIYGFNDGVFYYDNTEKAFYLDDKVYFYQASDVNDWSIIEHSNITNEIVDKRNLIPTSQAVYRALQNISPSGASVTELTSNLVLETDTPLNLESGFYKLGINAGVYYHSATAQNLILGNYELFYYDSSSYTLIMENRNWFYEGIGQGGDWFTSEHNNITNEIVDNRAMIPTSQAVYQALQNISPSGDIFYTELDTNITLNADGTTIPELQTGYYFLKRPRSISYIAYGGTTETDYGFNDGIFFYDSTNHFLKRTGINGEVTDEIEYQLNYIGSYNFWEPETLGKYDVVKKDDLFYTELHNNVICNTDGSVTCGADTLTEGYYFITAGHRLDYYEESTGTLINDYKFENNIFYYNGNTNKIYLNLLNNDLVTNYISYYLTYNSLENGWYVSHQNIDNFVYNGYKSQSQVLNSIPASRK